MKEKKVTVFLEIGCGDRERETLSCQLKPEEAKAFYAFAVRESHEFWRDKVWKATHMEARE